MEPFAHLEIQGARPRARLAVAGSRPMSSRTIHAPIDKCLEQAGRHMEAQPRKKSCRGVRLNDPRGASENEFLCRGVRLTPPAGLSPRPAEQPALLNSSRGTGSFRRVAGRTPTGEVAHLDIDQGMLARQVPHPGLETGVGRHRFVTPMPSGIAAEQTGQLQRRARRRLPLSVSIFRAVPGPVGSTDSRTPDRSPGRQPHLQQQVQVARLVFSRARRTPPRLFLMQALERGQQGDSADGQPSCR